MRLSRIGALGLAVLTGAAAGHAAAQDPYAPQEPVTQRHETFESAVQTPAEDLNLKQVPLPEVLQRAQINPYDMRTMEACDAVAAEVERLDAALGADRDEPPVPDTRTVDEKRDGVSAGALKLGIEAVTPYRGIVRWITGADARAKSVQEAIEAGFARRGFLKGMAVKMNCRPPAAPAWYRPVQSAQYRPAPTPATPMPAYAAPQGYDPYARAYADPYAQPYRDERAPDYGRSYDGYDPGSRAYAPYPGYRYDPYGR